MADATDANFEIVRTAFEAAMGEHYPFWSFASDGCGGYHNERTKLAWQGWMACFLRMTAVGVMVGRHETFSQQTPTAGEPKA